ncbi:MAG: hypothetical protein HQM02_06575 [Magnetococcales bacterium]|nr:hypothetical protein [Magnetococcales bacterium]
MSPAFINGMLAETTGWSFLAKNRPVGPSHFGRIAGRIVGRWSAFLWALIHRLTETAPPVARRQAAVETGRHIGLFIFLMEKALIGALVSLWLLAGWVVLDGLRTLFF